MSRGNRRRTRQHGKRSHSRDTRSEMHEDVPAEYCRGFKITRSLDEEQARDIRTALSNKLGFIPGLAIRGYSGHGPASASVIGGGETRGMELLRSILKSDLEEQLRERIPTLNNPARMSVTNIGRFGLRRYSKLSIAAAFDPEKAVTTYERGCTQAYLCELNDWNPVHLKSEYPHASFVVMPRNDDETEINDVVRVVREVVPKETELYFDRADVETY